MRFGVPNRASAFGRLGCHHFLFYLYSLKPLGDAAKIWSRIGPVPHGRLRAMERNTITYNAAVVPRRSSRRCYTMLDKFVG